MHGLIDFTSKELEKVTNFFDGQGLAGDLIKPYVFLSDKIFYRTYGKLSEEEMIVKLQEYARTMNQTSFYELFIDVIHTVIQNIGIDIRENNGQKYERSWSDLLPTMNGLERTVRLEGADEDKRFYQDF